MFNSSEGERPLKRRCKEERTVSSGERTRDQGDTRETRRRQGSTHVKGKEVVVRSFRNPIQHISKSVPTDPKSRRSKDATRKGQLSLPLLLSLTSPPRSCHPNSRSIPKSLHPVQNHLTPLHPPFDPTVILLHPPNLLEPFQLL